MRATILRIAGLSALLAAAAAAGCARDHEAIGDQGAGATTPIDRLLIGEAAGYRADATLRDRAAELAASQEERRKEAWAILGRVLEPVPVDPTSDAGVEPGERLTMPRFQTWFGKDEIVPMFEHALLSQTEADRHAHVPPSPEILEETFAWIAKRAPTLSSFSAERLAQRRLEIETSGTASLGGQERVLMSPAVVKHLLTHYDAMIRCIGAVPDGNADPPSDTNFAPCVGEEFPADAVVIKARWVTDTIPVEVFDTSAEGLTKRLTTGTWGDATSTATPGPESIYTMSLSSGLHARLVGLHVITKELRDWYWVSMFWSDSPKTDFGADRPDALAGVWADYKMCTSVDYDEHDDGDAGSGRYSGRGLDPSLAAALAATRAFGPRSWCSNPYLEQGAHNATTNCVGCHQHAGTTLATEAILGDPVQFPDTSRAKVRKNFPADYTFVTSSGLELALKFQTKLNSLPP